MNPAKLKGRTRAPNGSDQARVLLRMPADMDKLVRHSAKKRGITVSEWWRQAAIDRLMSDAQEVTALKSDGKGT